MGLHAQKYHVHGAGILQVSHHPWTRHEIVVGADHAHAFFLHGAQVRTTSVQRNVISLARHHCANVRAYSSGPDNQEFHFSPPANAAATARR